MNHKMTTNSQLSTTEPKKQKQKVTKETTRTGMNHRNGEHMDSYQREGGEGENRGKYTGNKKHNL